MNYNNLKVAELRNLHLERGLVPSGNKKDLVARLTISDEKRAAVVAKQSDIGASGVVGRTFLADVRFDLGENLKAYAAAGSADPFVIAAGDPMLDRSKYAGRALLNSDSMRRYVRESFPAPDGYCWNVTIPREVLAAARADGVDTRKLRQVPYVNVTLAPIA